MRRFFTIVITILIVAFILLVLVVLGIYKSGYHPTTEDLLDVDQGSWAQEMDAPADGKGLKVLFFNLNHGLGREVIWYEAKDPVEKAPDLQAISARLDKIVALVQDQEVNALVLQEVDFGSEATGKQDQAELLARRLGWPYIARARVQMSPFPLFPRPWSWNFSGSIDSGMAILSPHPIKKSVLYPLPGARDRGWVEDAFGPIGAVHEARIRISEEKELKILQIVLDRTDARTRERQAAAAAKWIEARDHHDAVIYATTWTEPMRRPKSQEEAEKLGEIEYTMDLLRHKGLFKAVVNDADFLRDPGSFGTWLGETGDTPLKRFDHLLHGLGIVKTTPELLPPVPELSDHIPLLLELDLP